MVSVGWGRTCVNANFSARKIAYRVSYYWNVRHTAFTLRAIQSLGSNPTFVHLGSVDNRCFSDQLLTCGQRLLKNLPAICILW